MARANRVAAGRRIAPGAAVAGLATSGCGASEPPPVKVSGPIEITQTDYRFSPQVVVARPGRTELIVRNAGRLPHTLRLERAGREVLAVSTIRPGESKRATIALREGNYRMLCAIGNHEELGMHGRIVVR